MKRNGRGPEGMGPMTGRGLGNCGAGTADKNVIEGETRRGKFGRGRGLGRIAGTNPEGGGMGRGRRGRGHGRGQGRGAGFGPNGGSW